MPYKIDFKQIAEDIDIYAVAQVLRLEVIKDRAHCPVCDSERALQFFPETNSFQCHAAGETRNSDCIALYAHIKGVGMYQAAKALQEHFGTASAARTAPVTTPTRPKRGTVQAQPSPPRPASRAPAPFDPESFAAKLTYSSEVEALDINKDDAARLGVGFHPQRKRVYFPIRNPDNSISGFIGRDGKELKMPPSWQTGNIVPMRRKA